jgi:hypothetical protein
MFTNLKPLVLLAVTILLISGKLSAQTRNDFIGKWNTFAPDAPDENQKSTICIKSDTISISFDGVTFMPADFTELKNDTLRADFGGVTLTMEYVDKTNLKGLAVWSSGRSELVMKRKDESGENPASGKN